MNLERALEITRNFALENYANAAAAIVCGSAARGNWKTSSDIDLIVVLEDANVPFTEAVDLNGLEIHLIMIPAFRATKILLDERHARKGVYVSIFANGKVLWQKGNTGQQLIDMAKLVQQEGPRPFTQEELRVMRFQSSELLANLETDRPFAEKTHIFYQVLDMLLQIHLCLRKGWLNPGKERARELKRVDAAGLATSQEVTQTFFAQQDPAPFVKWGRSVLDQVGGTMDKFTSRSIYSDITENRMVVLITPSKPLPPNGLLATIKLLLGPKPPRALWYTLRLDDKTVVNTPSYLMIMQAPQQDIKEKWLPWWLERHRLVGKQLQEKGVQLALPFVFNSAAPLVGKGLDNIEPLLAGIMRDLFATAQEKPKENPAMAWANRALQTMLHYFDQQGLKGAARQVIGKYMVHRKLPTVVDVDGVFSYRELAQKRQEVLTEYQRTYKGQSMALQQVVKQGAEIAPHLKGSMAQLLATLQQPEAANYAPAYEMALAQQLGASQSQAPLWVLHACYMDKILSAYAVPDRHACYLVWLLAQLP